MSDFKPATSATMAVASSALRAQQERLRIISENMANVESTATTPEGDPYRRQMPVFEPTPVAGAQGVRLSRVQPDTSPFLKDYNPGHPAADADGYVKMPNVNPLTESLDMRAALRAYDANLSVIETARAMQTRTLDLLKR